MPGLHSSYLRRNICKREENFRVWVNAINVTVTVFISSAIF